RPSAAPPPSGTARGAAPLAPPVAAPSNAPATAPLPAPCAVPRWVSLMSAQPERMPTASAAQVRDLIVSCFMKIFLGMNGLEFDLNLKKKHIRATVMESYQIKCMRFN